MKYFSTFSGIGGFELGIHRIFPDAECVGFSEFDPIPSSVYKRHFPGHKEFGDITKIDADSLPDFDLLVGGFPCQAFSIAGKRMGFNETRGTLFFDLARILKAKRPKWFVFENVKGLLNHDEGRTLGTIINTLHELGYATDCSVLNSKDFGVPQNGERILIVGTNQFEGLPDFWHFEFPRPPMKRCLLVDVLEKDVDKRYFLNEKTVKRLLNEDGGFKSKVNPEIGSCLFALMHKLARGMDLIALGNVSANGKDTISSRVYSPNGIASTVSSLGGGLGAKTGLYMVDYPSRKKGVQDKNESPTIRAQTHGKLPCVAIPVLTPDRVEKRQDGRRFKNENDPSFTITAQDRHGVYDGVGIRRLTPTECARLQGFPDDWCDGLSDTRKYQCYGNAVTTNVIEAVMGQLKLHQ